ncbi:MAG TPA: hypothetical protein VGZ00_02385 [Candidatus Baltobacteraceae bacterium]|jgi:hypothetical protein|nr:hypothetical protein [Candidatus Baltobacteraceae bacterium]
MALEKRIVCLANSWKNAGRCIAGKEVLESTYGRWVRPVSNRPSAEISEEERNFADGASPEVMDVISIPIISAAPFLYQSENYVIDSHLYWKRLRTIRWDDLKYLIDEPDSIWSSGSSRPSDRVPAELASNFITSLMFIEVKELTVLVRPNDYFKRKVRAKFRYKGKDYNLAVTDPRATTFFLLKPDGEYPLVGAYLCISLGAEWGGACYKLVATIFSREFYQT